MIISIYGTSLQDKIIMLALIMLDQNITHLAQNIKNYMSHQKITASALSSASGVSMASVSRILAGQVNPGIKHISAIAKALDVTIDDLTKPYEKLKPVSVKNSDLKAKESLKIKAENDLRAETDVLASFVLDNTDYTPTQAARLLANAATGSWIHSWTQDLVALSDDIQPRPTVAIQTGKKKISVDVAFPESLFEAGSIVSLISVITAACTSTGARVEDIRIPPVLLRTYLGPGMGVQGLRDRAQKYGRPLLSATMRPITGLSPRMYGQAVFETLKGGVDISCDPTLLHHIPSNNWRDRFRYNADAVADAQDFSSEIKFHAANVTAANYETMLERAEFALEQGTHALLIDSGAVGMAGVQTLGQFCHKNGLLLCALGGRALHNGPLSQQLVAKLLRFAGADVVSVGSPLRGQSAARRNVNGIAHALEGENIEAFPEGHIMFDQPTPSLSPAWPACGGGHNPWHFPQLLDAFGNNVILQCGGSTMGHPWGSLAGATANRVAIEALVKAKIEGQHLANDGRHVLKQAAKYSPELKESLTYWQEGSFLFGVINNTQKDNLSNLVVKDEERKKPDLKPIDS